MPKFIDLSRKQFGSWTVLSYATNQNWLCKCVCGHQALVNGQNLREGKSTACIHCRRQKHIIHGHSVEQTQSPTYSTYRNMVRRCTDPNNKDWKNYGARGITVCKRWLNGFQYFLKDMGVKPDGLTLERINNNKGYNPSNCIWIPKSQQSRNRRPLRRKNEKH